MKKNLHMKKVIKYKKMNPNLMISIPKIILVTKAEVSEAVMIKTSRSRDQRTLIQIKKNLNRSL